VWRPWGWRVSQLRWETEKVCRGHRGEAGAPTVAERRSTARIGGPWALIPDAGAGRLMNQRMRSGTPPDLLANEKVAPGQVSQVREGTLGRMAATKEVSKGHLSRGPYERGSAPDWRRKSSASHSSLGIRQSNRRSRHGGHLGTEGARVRNEVLVAIEYSPINPERPAGGAGASTPLSPGASRRSLAMKESGACSLSAPASPNVAAGDRIVPPRSSWVLARGAMVIPGRRPSLRWPRGADPKTARDAVDQSADPRRSCSATTSVDLNRR